MPSGGRGPRAARRGAPGGGEPRPGQGAAGRPLRGRAPIWPERCSAVSVLAGRRWRPWPPRCDSISSYPPIAIRQDLDDPAVVTAVADRVGDRSSLRLLFLLTVADARATGPESWSSWRASLVRSLFSRADAEMARRARGRTGSARGRSDRGRRRAGRGHRRNGDAPRRRHAGGVSPPVRRRGGRPAYPA